jgi:predicted acyltransferase
MTANKNDMTKLNAQPRLLSLDVFRGITVAAMILVNTPGDWGHVYAPLLHSKWNGCTPTDVIFPAFLFMVGVSLVYALQKKKADKELHFKILTSAFRRMVTLIAIGLAISFFYRPDFSHLRFPGVLQRIGLVYFLTTVLFLKVNLRALDWILGLILIGYYVIMTCIPIPGGYAPNINPETNIAAFIDRAVFSIDHLWRFTKTWDPVGLLSTLPAIATTLFGVRVGVWLKRPDKNSFTKCKWLLIAGVITIVLGLLTDMIFPINKALWTSSYVLYTGGICTIGLALTYWLVDIKGYSKICWPFLVFGTNAISAYVLSEVLPGVFDLFKFNIKGSPVTGMKVVYRLLISPGLSAEAASLLSAVVFVFLIWIIMYPLYKRKIIIKI